MTRDKLTFSADIRPDFIKDLRQRVNHYFKAHNLSKYGNAGIIIKSIIMIAVYLGPYALMMTGIVHSIVGIAISWMVMGFGMAGLGMVLMHDANHGTFSKNRKVNSFLSKSLYLLGGFPPNWKYQHNILHHGYTNIEGHDDDIAPPGFLRFSPHRPLYKVHRFQQWYAWFFYGIMTLSWITVKDFRQVLNYKSDAQYSTKSTFRLFSELISTKILYYLIFLVVPLIVLPIPWYLILIFFILMHFICGLILGVIFQTAHVMPSSEYPLPNEDGNVENNWAIHQLLTTSNYSPKNTIFSWLIGGLNYQIEHHLFPYISHVHYKKISALVKETTQKYNLPYHVQDTFYMAVINHFRMLKMLGQKSS